MIIINHGYFRIKKKEVFKKYFRLLKLIKKSKHTLVLF